MMNYIWGALIIISIICSIITGRVGELSDSIFNGASDSISLVISILGMMCLWTGLLKIAEKGGLTAIIAKLFSPLMKLLFPEYKQDSKACHAICMNITANLLGLGNAATPMGIAAMKEMQKQNTDKKTANNSMAMFVVINTASIQLVPTLMATLRQKHGSVIPLDILPAVWLNSLVTLIVGILMAKLLEKRGNKLG